MHSSTRLRRWLVSVATGLASVSPAFAQQSTLDRLEQLEREVGALKQQLAAGEEAGAAANNPRVELGKHGLKLTSPDGDNTFRIRGYVQLDSRSFISDDEELGVDTFLVRRARPIFEGTAGDFGFRLMPDFGGGAAQVFDAYAEYRPSTRFNLRGGKFKPPVGLDRLRSASDLSFVERSLPTNLVPTRDRGLMAYGELAPGLTYELGLFNGVEDTGNSTSDIDDHKELAARFFAHPFRGSDSGLAGLGIGIAGTWGEKEGSTSSPQVGDYRSTSLARIFRYRSTTLADGDHWRIAPQGYFHYGPFGVQVEYTMSSQEVRNGANLARIENTAWETQFSYVLNGGQSAFQGWPTVAGRFDPGEGDWGIWAIAARYGQLDVDAAAFPVFADAATAVSHAENFGIALHTYLSDSFRIIFDYEHMRFEAGAAMGADRETEQVIHTRLDYKF